MWMAEHGAKLSRMGYLKGDGALVGDGDVSGCQWATVNDQHWNNPSDG